jgi:hypothetical protein
MYLQYGSYRHATNEAAVTITRQTNWNDGGQALGFTESWHITGFLVAASQAALTTALADLKAAYNRQAQNLSLHLDDGTLTNHFLNSAQCIGGTRVTEGPTFPEGQGAEYSTFRSYSIVVQGEVADPRVRLLTWSESLAFSGGGPMYVHLQPITGLPVKQQVADATTYRVTQSGEAVGRFTYPSPPGPIWPAALLPHLNQFHQRTPRRSGPIGSPDYTEFPITWSYSFESAVSLRGNPIRWLG